jgi:alkylhydroperoxidase family enzyme
MGNGTGRYAGLTKRLIDSVLGTPGHTATELRRAVFARARPSSPLSGTERGTVGQDIPPDLAGYVDKVALHAYKVTDEDLAALKRAGNSDDLLFEVTVSAALGAAVGRLERGLSALRGEH